MSSTENINMTEGEPGRIIFRFSLPLILANLFQQLYNCADTMIVGRFNGDDALAAVGVSFSVTLVMISLATGTGIGASVLLAKYYGGGQRRKLLSGISTVLIFTLLLSLVTALLGVLLTRPLLQLLDTPKNILSDAAAYLRIYSFGVPFMFLYNVCASVFNAMGNSKTPFRLLVISSLTNIILDLIFVGVLSLGVSGAAWATFIAQGLSALLSLGLLISRVYGGDRPEFKIFSFALLREMSSYAAVSIVQQSLTSVGLMLVQSAANRFGSAVLAGYTAASKIDSFAIMPFIACGNALSTYAAQNLGAGRVERIKDGYRAGIRLCALLSLLAFALMLPLRRPLLGIFMDLDSSSPEAVSAGLSYITQMAFCYFLMGLNTCFNGLLRGSGRLRIFLSGSILNLIVRVVFTYAAVDTIGVCAVWLSMPVSWIIGFIYSRLAVKITNTDAARNLL